MEFREGITLSERPETCADESHLDAAISVRGPKQNRLGATDLIFHYTLYLTSISYDLDVKT